MIKKILIALVAIIVILIAVVAIASFATPTDFKVEREVTINKPKGIEPRTYPSSTAPTPNKSCIQLPPF